MIIEKLPITRTGTLTIRGVRFEPDDSQKFAQLFFRWLEYKNSGEFVKQRANIPEGLTEGLVAKDIPHIYRKQGDNYSNPDREPTKFDCYDKLNDKIVEVKACSVPNDLTSWSPKPYFDIFYFVDFSTLDGKYKIYEISINSDEIMDIKVNSTQTFREVVSRSNPPRPRFSVFETFIYPKFKCSGYPVVEDDLNNYL